VTPALLLASSAASKTPGADIEVSAWAWAAFIGLIVALLLADLFLFHREAHEISIREAAFTSVFWVALGLSFKLVVWWTLGGAAAGQYLTGYVIEKVCPSTTCSSGVILSYANLKATLAPALGRVRRVVCAPTFAGVACSTLSGCSTCSALLIFTTIARGTGRRSS
jgi:hypothetical protein